MSRSGNKVIYVVTEKANETKVIEGELRNEGFAARARSVANLDELIEQISILPPDLVIRSESAKDASLDEVLKDCNSRNPPLPVVALAPSLALDGTLEAMRSGARDLVSLTESAHLSLVLIREIDAFVNSMSRVNAERRLQELEVQHSLLLRESGAAIAKVQEGIVIMANPAWLRLHGQQDEDAIVGLPLMDLVSPDDRERLKKSLQEWQSLGDESSYIELNALNQAGQLVGLAIEVTNSAHDDERCLELSARPSSNNVSSSGASNESDRMALADALNQIIDKGVNEPRAAAFFIRVDEYEVIEDRIGFVDVERIMQQLRKAMDEHFLQDADLYRYSLSELAVVAHSAEATVFRDRGESLVKHVADKTFRTENHEFSLTVSVVVYPLLGSEEPQKLLRELRADAEKLSSDGGNRALFSGPGAVSAETREQELAMLDDIKAALKENRFQLAYQTIASLEGNQPPIFDAWLRMIDKTGTELKARDFLPIAERHDLMPLIDHWVVQQATATIREKSTEGNGQPITIFIRLSEATIRKNEGFLKWLTTHLQSKPIPKGSLVVELEERSVLEYNRPSKGFATRLRELNIRLAIVRFGAHKNADSLLEELKPDYVKLDPAYTGSLAGRDSQADEVARLLDATKRHGVMTIAERIDDANAMARLWQLGIHFLQGNHVQEAEVVLSAADVHIS